MPCNPHLRVFAFAFSLVVAVASLTACAPGRTPVPVDAPVTVEQVATPEPTPTPTPPPVTDPNTGLNQTVTIQDKQGYTLSVSVQLQLGAWVTSTANSLPGHAVASAPLEGTISVTNTTSGRNTNLGMSILPGLEYPAGSASCTATGPGGANWGVEPFPKTADGKYCLIYLDMLDGAAILTVGQTVKLAALSTVGDPGLAVGGTEAAVPQLIAAASKPVGMFLLLKNMGDAYSFGQPPLACALNSGGYLGEPVILVIATSPGFVCVK
jgi:hypothetical protein